MVFQIVFSCFFAERVTLFVCFRLGFGFDDCFSLFLSWCVLTLVFASCFRFCLSVSTLVLLIVSCVFWGRVNCVSLCGTFHVFVFVSVSIAFGFCRLFHVFVCLGMS